MPLPRHMVENMEREYGPDAVRIAHATANKYPERMRKAVRTARKKGHGGVVQHFKGKRKARGRR